MSTRPLGADVHLVVDDDQVTAICAGQRTFVIAPSDLDASPGHLLVLEAATSGLQAACTIVGVHTDEPSVTPGVAPLSLRLLSIHRA